jgi:uncharacterized caspase-like protein
MQKELRMTFQQGHALLVGVGGYRHAPERAIPATVTDAQALARLLCDPAYCGYPADQVTLLRDASATRSGLVAALEDLASRTRPDDTVLFFYSGHGDYDAQGGYYLTCHDTRFADGYVAEQSGLHQHDLLRLLQGICAQRVLLIVNACHAGELAPTELAPTQGAAPPTAPASGHSLPRQASAALLATGRGRVIITACRENQVAFVGPGPLTIFAEALLYGLRGEGSVQRGGYLSVFDLYTYLSTAVASAVRYVSPALKQRYGAAQEPELTILKGVGPFAVSLYRGAAPGQFAAPATPPGGAAVRQLHPDYSETLLRQLQSSGDQVQGGGSGAQPHIDSGGTTHGPVVGLNMRTVNSSSAPTHPHAPPTLADMPERVRQQGVQAQLRGEHDLAEDLEEAARQLEAALRAQAAGNAARSTTKMGQARAALADLAQQHPAVQPVLNQLDQLRAGAS